MLPKDKILVQELLAHPAWEIFKDHLCQSRKAQLMKDLQVAGRLGEAIKSASITGRLDELDVVLDLPSRYLRGEFKG